MDEPRPCDQNPGREGGPLGLAQTTSTILRNGFEIDRRMGYLEPTALGREGGFPGSLGKAGRRAHAHEVYGSDAHPTAFPHRSPGEGVGSRGRLGGCQGGSMLGTAGGPAV